MLAGCDVQIEQRQLQSFLSAACVSPFWHPEAAVLLVVVDAEQDAGWVLGGMLQQASPALG